jgi:spore maturation protein CgeB
MDANNRLFDLSMAGCCQVCNGVQVVEKYFNKSEVATADDPDQWIEKIDYYLQHESEREILGQNARRRALADHTWQLRATDFIRIFEENYSKYNNRNQSVSILVKIVRYADQFITPPYLLKEIRIVRFFLTKIGLYTKK